MEMSLDAVHVGFHKCASSFIQVAVLGGHENINSISMMKKGWWEENKEVFFKLVNHVGTSHFDRQESRNKVNNAIRKCHDEGKVNVLSCEAFSGNISSLGRDRDISEHLRSVLGDVRVIVVYREQYSMLLSVWRELIRVGHSMSLKSFIKSEAKYSWESKKYKSIYSKIEYDKNLRMLKDVFGEENVLPLFLEELKKDAKKFVNKIYDFVGVERSPIKTAPRRKSYGPFLTYMLRKINSLSETQREPGILPERIYWLSRSLAEKMNLEGIRFNYKNVEKVRRNVPSKIKYNIERSNKRLSKMVSFDIEKAGYSV